MKDQAIQNLLAKELHRQRNGIELIASENFVSYEVMKTMGSCLTNKYAEGYPGKRYYGGCEVVDEIETLAINRLCELFGAEYANVQPHSGAQANMAVQTCLLNPGDTIMGLDLAHGGHLSHGSPVNFSGKNYKVEFYHVEKETGRISMQEIREKAQSSKPKMIICGASAYSRDWDYKELRAIADEVGATLLADIAHPAGLIAAGLLNDPMKHCHIVTSTTHKTLRGPRGGIIMMGKDYDNPMGKTDKKGNLLKMSHLLNMAVFPGIQGGPLEHVIASKAVAFGEALQPEFKVYCKQVIANSKSFAKAFTDKGYSIVSGGTDNHLFLLDLHSVGVTGKLAENTLVEADITVNKNMIPFDPTPPMTTSGIRLGTAAMTSRGFKENDFIQGADWIDYVLRNHDQKSAIQEIKSKVNKYMEHFSLYPEIG